MATLADLQARIISEANRPDLADTMAADLQTLILKSIDQYADSPWWFNEVSVTSAFTPSVNTLALPTGLRLIRELFLVVGNVRYPLRAQQPAYIDQLYTTPIKGQPTDYAMLGSNIYVWPTPNVAYPVIWDLIADVTPALDFANPSSSVNAWTNQGQDLITARAKLRLYRDYLSASAQDPRVANAAMQEEEAYSRLKGETNRRISTGRMRAGW